jgi:hypothetical protein
MRAQIVNFDGNGKKIKSVSESVLISIDTFPNEKISPHIAGIIGSIAGPLVNLAAGAISSHLKNREASFTAQYQGFCSAKSFYQNGNFNIDRINITRKIWVDNQEKEAGRIVLKAERDAQLFRLRVDSVLLHYSKARIKDNNDRLSLNIDLEIIGNWREMNSKDDIHVKSVSLGKSGIVINNISPGVNAITPAVYSDWFLMIPIILPADKLGASGWYSILVTVKEANARGISSKKIYEFFHDNGAEMADVIKALVPAE